MKANYGRWTYGDAGDEYPVEPGDVWGVGHHTLACADLETGQVDDVINRYARGKPEIVYCDPPWDKGNARSFRTKAAVGRAVDFDLFLASLINVIKKCDHAYIEMGHRNHEALTQTIEACGGHVLAVWDIVYYRKHPCLLTGATFSQDRPWPKHDDYTGLDDDFTPAETLSRYPPGLTVFDPCMGRGNTAIAAHEAGHQFVGTELHPRRMAVTIRRLVEAYNLTARKL